MLKIRAERMANGTYNLYTPYSKAFVARIKNIGGRRWDPEAKAWNIPASGIDAARAAMMDCYGETDIPAVNPRKEVTIRVRFDEEYHQLRGGVEAFGRTLAVAWGRDSGAVVGDNVILEQGKVRSGGSCKNWLTVIEAGSVFRMVIPESIYLKGKDEWNAEVVENAPEPDKRVALTAEKEKLLARLAEIEKELKALEA